MKKIFCLFILALYFSGCTTTEDKTSSYVGPGSEYSITFNESASTFELKESTSSLEVNGSYETLSTGFKMLTISTVSGGGSSPPSVGDKAYGVDIPGVVFLLKPLGSTESVISMVSSGSCPTADFGMNWIITGIDRDQKLSNTCGSGDPGTDSIGTFSYVNSTEKGTLPKMFDICGDSITTNVDLGTISCSAGKGKPSSDSTATMYLTSNGGSIVKFSDDNQIIVALPVDKVSSIADMKGDYIGMVMVDGATSRKVYTVKSTAGTDGVFSFDEIDPTTGTVITTNQVNGKSTMTTINSPADGFTSGTFELTGIVSDKKVTCMTNQNIYSTGKNFIFCIGQDPFDDENMINVLLISKG
tara:strand:- start:796 stop:1866 length:1071 start_codon:yes stop_codon:yes gene_type:complete